MSTSPLYLDIHVLQTLPPSNINRDDAGSPKQAIYGGVRRARVSSQAWKRATRVELEKLLPSDQASTRTARILGLLTAQLEADHDLTNEQATELASALLSQLQIKTGKKAENTAYLLFFGESQLKRLSSLVIDDAHDLINLPEKERTVALKELDVAGVLRTGHPAAVGLFGRMVADFPNLNVDAATQFAHAISTHAVETEFDYFTAVDDENSADQTGAGMIGTVEFNSATYYRFVTLGVHQLLENLNGDLTATLDVLNAFIRSFVLSMPSGHINSFGNRTAPGFVGIALRDDQPVNLVSAFEKPVWSRDGLLASSLQRLAHEQQTTSSLWDLPPLATFATFDSTLDDSGEVARAFGAPQSFETLVAAAHTAVDSALQGE